MNEEKELEENNTSSIISPGTLLRQAREAREMSLDDVSAVLHLDVELIAALEADDYENLPASTFVKGYLRGYARLLNLNADTLVEAFECQGCREAYVVADISISSQAGSNDVLMKIVTLGVILALIVLIFLWWQTQPEQSDFNGLNDVSTNEQEDVVFDTSDISQDNSTESFLPPDSALYGQQESVSEDAEVVSNPEESELPEQQVEVSEINPAFQVNQIEVEEPVTEKVDTVVPDEKIIPETEASLVLHFKYDSWVEIYARDNKKLYYNTAKKGKTISLQGLAPIKVLIGYARGVSIEYNGKSFDAGPYTNRQIARFTLGGKAPATVNALN